MNTIFEGVATALYTPFTKNGIDYESFENLIYRQLSAKVDALVVLGTTGESSTISLKERTELIKFTISKVKGKVPVIVGAGSNCTKTACELSLQAKSLGADGVLSVTPYYNKCEQDGLFYHYEEICKTAKIPLICYNVPKRTGLNLEVETALKLCSIDYVFGFKEANSDVKHVKKFMNFIADKKPVYLGCDELIKEFYSLGAKGVISVASNVIPLKIKEYISDFENFYETHNFDIDEFFKLLMIKINPIPIKTIASILFNENCNFRLPLTYPDKESVAYIKSKLKSLNL